MLFTGFSFSPIPLLCFYRLRVLQVRKGDRRGRMPH